MGGYAPQTTPERENKTAMRLTIILVGPAPVSYTHLMLQVYLVRHGETQWNAERRIQGQSDSPLTAHGERQAW